MAKKAQSKTQHPVKPMASVPAGAAAPTGKPNFDPGALIVALRQAEERVSELTDLVSRLNRALRQLEEQNQRLAAQIQGGSGQAKSR